jgi:hypothetical protein
MELKKFYALLLKYFCFLSVFVMFCGCPRIAYLDAYNNTAVNIELNSAGYIASVLPGKHSRIRFTGSFFNIKSELGDWKYNRNIPYSGRDGEFFDGTLNIQIEGDGKVYAIRKGDKSPIQILNYEQPDGYPISPDYKQ